MLVIPNSIIEYIRIVVTTNDATESTWTKWKISPLSVSLKKKGPKTLLSTIPVHTRYVAAVVMQIISGLIVITFSVNCTVHCVVSSQKRVHNQTLHHHGPWSLFPLKIIFFLQNRPPTNPVIISWCEDDILLYETFLPLLSFL